MKKILISWIATNHDFLQRNAQGEMVRSETQFNEEGPHFSLYRDFPNFDAHYLLSQNSENGNNTKWNFLASTLKNRFKKEVILKFMDIDDILSVGTIKGKVDTFLQTLPDDCDIEIFMNPGTPAMQTAWYLIGSEMQSSKNIKFFKRRESRYIKGNGIPEKEYVAFDGSEFARIVNIRDITSKKETIYKKPFITPSLQDSYIKALQVAGNDRTTVLIQGETGTGKEYLARYIHEESNRKNRPYITINCASFNGELLESRLFGYVKGAFTGADRTTKGAFEDAQGGTIFLDEIGDISQRMQVTLLRVLEEKEISKIGSTDTVPLDVRIVTATNKDLWQMVRDGKFRDDLYHRLAIAEIELPAFRSFPMKERRAWIEHFLETLYTTLEKRYLSKVSKEVWDFLLSYPFHGNIRELRNTIETFYTFCDQEIQYKDIPKRMLRMQELYPMQLDMVIKEHIEKVVDFCDGNLSMAANLLGKDRGTVRKYL